MQPKFSTQEIVSVILHAIESSKKEYEKWNEDILRSTPEYFVTVNIAKELMSNVFSKDGSSVTFEWNIGDTIKAAPGRPFNHYKPNGRFDLAVWNSNGCAWGFIEIKRSTGSNVKYEKDIKRIRAALLTDTSSHLKAGFFASYIERDDTGSKSAEEKVTEFIDKMENERIPKAMNGTLKWEMKRGKLIRYNTGHKDVDSYAFQPICVVVKK